MVIPSAQIKIFSKLNRLPYSCGRGVPFNRFRPQTPGRIGLGRGSEVIQATANCLTWGRRGYYSLGDGGTVSICLTYSDNYLKMIYGGGEGENRFHQEDRGMQVAVEEHV